MFDKQKLKNIYAIAGIIFGICGASITMHQEFIVPQPTLTEMATKTVIEKTKEFLGRPKAREKTNWLRIIQITLGSFAVILGLVSWIENENRRLSILAINFGLMAAAWEFVIVLFFIAGISALA